MGAFHPALCLGSASARNRDAWCWVGAPGAHGFHHGKWPLAFRKCPFFPAAREGYSVRVLSPPPIRPKSRVTPVGRSTGTLYPTGKNRVLTLQNLPGRTSTALSDDKLNELYFTRLGGSGIVGTWHQRLLVAEAFERKLLNVAEAFERKPREAFDEQLDRAELAR